MSERDKKEMMAEGYVFQRCPRPDCNQGCLGTLETEQDGIKGRRLETTLRRGRTLFVPEDGWQQFVKELISGVVFPGSNSESVVKVETANDEGVVLFLGHDRTQSVFATSMEWELFRAEIAQENINTPSV